MTVPAPVKLGTLVFKSPINLEGSWGSRRLARNATSEMTLYLYEDDASSAFIEWVCDELDLVEHIGLALGYDARTGMRRLEDYDGVFSLPAQAARLLRMHGIVVGKEFTS